MTRVLPLVGSLPATTAVPAIADAAEVNGLRIYCEVSGDGDPPVVPHGAHMNIPSMGEILPRLAEAH